MYVLTVLTLLRLCSLTCKKISVSDPYSLNLDPDPDPAKNLNPDPDPDPDPGKFFSPAKKFA